MTTVIKLENLVADKTFWWKISIFLYEDGGPKLSFGVLERYSVGCIKVFSIGSVSFISYCRSHYEKNKCESLLAKGMPIAVSVISPGWWL